MHTPEQLEARIAPASASLTYTDVDGDLITITASYFFSEAPPLSLDDLTFVGGGSSGQLARLDLTDPGFNRASITFKVTKSGGDGFVHVGMIDASGNDLGKVVVPGDLGKISMGKGSTGLNLLSVRSMGEFGVATQGGEGDLLSQIRGRIDRLKVVGDIKVSLEVFSAIDSMTVGGDVSGDIDHHSSIHKVRIAGDVSGSISSGGMKRVYVGGNVTGSIDGDDLVRIRIRGDLTGWIYGYTLYRARIDGSVIGSNTSGNMAGSGTIIGDESIGRIIIGGDLIGGDVTGDESVEYSGTIEGGTISRIVIGGSLIAGTDAGEGSLFHSGTICAGFDIGSIKIGKSIVGNETNPALILAEEESLPDGRIDLAIGSVSVGGKVEFAEILAGYSFEKTPVNPDASVGMIVVGGKWIASSVVAGAQDSGAPGFGVGDTIQANDVSPLVSQIAKILIKGNVTGSLIEGDSFGFVAQKIGMLSVGGHRIALKSGPSSDDISLGITNDVHVLEV
jgi:hypothetical protein